MQIVFNYLKIGMEQKIKVDLSQANCALNMFLLLRYKTEKPKSY